MADCPRCGRTIEAVLTSPAPVDEIFQLRPLAREQELRPRIIEAGLIEPARELVQLANPPAQGVNHLIAHGGLGPFPFRLKWSAAPDF
jgi:hypothetical protein